MRLAVPVVSFPGFCAVAARLPGGCHSARRTPLPAAYGSAASGRGERRKTAHRLCTQSAETRPGYLPGPGGGRPAARSSWRVLGQNPLHVLADGRRARCGAARGLAQNLRGAAAPNQSPIAAVEQVDLQGGNLIVDGTGFAVGRAAPVAAPITAPVATPVGAELFLTLVDDQPGLYPQVATAVGPGRAQAALLELPGNGVAQALFGEVAAQSRIVRAVLQGRLLPAPAAVGGEITAGIEVVLKARALAGAEKQQSRDQ